MSDKHEANTGAKVEEAPKAAWQKPTIEEMPYTATEAVPSPGPALIDGVFYTH